MPCEWISLDRIARARGLTFGEATVLAEREHWPKVFKTHEILVLAPKAALAKA